MKIGYYKKSIKAHEKGTIESSMSPLSEKLKIAISQIYCVVTNEITQKEWFKGIPSLKDNLKEIKEF